MRPSCVYLEDNQFAATRQAFELALVSEPLQKPVMKAKVAIEELVVPANFHGKITLTFGGGEIRIQKEVF